jgi:hypothetical protein
MVSTEWNCTLPVYNELPDWRYAPIIRQTSRVNGGGQTFELTEDLDFSEQFDSWGISNRTYTPIRNNNGIITAYSVSKTGIMYNGQRKIFQKRVTNSDLTPFMNIILPEDNVLSIESIIVKQLVNEPPGELIKILMDCSRLKYSSLSDLRRAISASSSSIEQL